MAAAANRFGFKIDKGLDQTWQAEFVVASGGSNTIAQGTPTKSTPSDGSVVGAIIPMVDGDGIVTAERFTGIAKTTSTDQASVAGIVDVWVPVPGLLYRGYAKSSTAVDTQAELVTYSGKRVVFDLSSSVWTVDTEATDALVNCVVIIGGIPKTSEIIFYYSPKGTFFDTSTSM